MIKIKSSELEQCTSLDQVVELINSVYELEKSGASDGGVLTSAELAAQYAVFAAVDFANDNVSFAVGDARHEDVRYDDVNEADIEAHLEILSEAGAEFDAFDALNIAKKNISEIVI